MADNETVTQTNEGLSSQERASLVAQMVSAYFGANAVAPENIQSVVGLLATSLDAAITPPAPVAVEPTVTKPEPAVPVKKSIQQDYLVCLVDGKKMKSLKRHLAKLGLTPDEYRKLFDLDADYPMVAPSYSAKRSELAKAAGLGKSAGGRRRKAVVADVSADASVENAEQVPADASEDLNETSDLSAVAESLGDDTSHLETEAERAAEEAATASEPTKRKSKRSGEAA